MGLQPAPTLAVGQIGHEALRFGHEDGALDLVLGRVGATVGDVLAHGTMQQAAVLRHHPDGGAQAVLRHLGHVLPVNGDRPAFDIVKAQQQVHQRGFPRAGPSDQPHAFARRDMQRQVVQHRQRAVDLIRAVAEGHIVKAHRARPRDQRLGARCVLHHARDRERGYPVAHRAHVFEQRGEFPHDPMRHVVQPQRQRHRDSNCADADQPARPQHQPDEGDRRHQQHVHRRQQHVLQSRQPHLAVNRLQEAVHAVAHPAFFSVGMREQLDRGDVGIAVDHLPGHGAAGIRLFLRHPAQTRHDLPQHHPVSHAPGHEGQRQPPVLTGRQRQRAEEIDDDIGRHVHDLHRHFAHRQRRLHQPLRDAPGEFILEIADRLAQQVTMRLPADALREVAQQRLVHDQAAKRAQGGEYHQQHEGHDRQPLAFDLPELVAGRVRQPVHQIAQIAEQRQLDQRDQPRGHRQHHQPRQRAPRIVQQKAPEAARGHPRRLDRIGIEPAFKPAKHHSPHSVTGRCRHPCIRHAAIRRQKLPKRPDRPAPTRGWRSGSGPPANPTSEAPAAG